MAKEWDGTLSPFDANRRATDGQRDTAPGVPEGWRLAPVEPDAAMKAAGALACGRGWDFAHHTWTQMLAVAPAPPEGAIQTDTIDRLTRQKAAHIIERDGFKVSGVVLTKPGGDSCIVDKGAVRWLDSRQLFSVMHPDAPPDGDGELDRRDAERYRAIRACGSEWSGLRVFNSRGELDPQSLDAEADCLVAAMAAGKVEKKC